MERRDQTLDEILGSLRPVESSWEDDYAREVLSAVSFIPEKAVYAPADLRHLLERDFKPGLTASRLILDLSKDEFFGLLRAELEGAAPGIQSFQRDTDRFVDALVRMGTLDALNSLRSMPVTWRDLLKERLKGGRGSAIKGQARGRLLEDFTEEIVTRVFGSEGFDTRCRFVGAAGTETEKADFAIPSRGDPRVIIEAKAYGATGSKQTDVLGDIGRIVERKRHDTHLLLVTDGVTWKARRNDLRKLVKMQNQGLISRIYTRAMASELEADLRDLKRSHRL